jgi:hypothetical protein
MIGFQKNTNKVEKEEFNNTIEEIKKIISIKNGCK